MAVGRAADYRGVLDRRHLWAAFLAAASAAMLAWLVFPAARSFIYPAIAALSTAAILAGIRLNRPPSALPWLLVAVAAAAFALADLLYETVPEPAPTIIYFLSYPPMAAAIVLLIWPRPLREAFGELLDAAIGAAAFAAIHAAVVVVPALDEPGVELGPNALLLGYPVLDVFLLLLVVRAGSEGLRTSACRLLAAGLAAQLVADQWYTVVLDTYVTTHVLDVFWLASYVLTAAAVLHPTMRKLPVAPAPPERWLRRFRMGLLAGGLVVPPVLLTVLDARHSDGTILAVSAGMLVTAVLVLLRVRSLLNRSEVLRVAERRARAEAEAGRAGVVAQNHRLQSLDRMKDGVLASVSHEFRSPLTSIRGHLRLLTDQASDRLDEQHLRSLAVIDRSSERLVRLVEDVLLVARMRSGHFDVDLDAIDVGALAFDCVEAARPAAAARDVAIELRAEADLPPASGDAARICQVIDNLISNAVKFSYAGSAVVVSVTRGSDTIDLEVADTGAGMSPVDRALLFEPFSRGATAASRHTPGTGLGLYISKSIVDAHGGAIHVDSALGEGTRARVTLPAYSVGPVEPREGVAA